MKLRGLTLILNEDCNFHCRYCYKPKKKEASLDYPRARRALAFFLPYLGKDYQISFYGGEPLLCFETIRKIVSFLDERGSRPSAKVRYSLTTNGSLLSGEAVEFLGKHRFAVTLSFDGLAQDRQRQKGSFDRILSRLKTLRDEPGLDLSVNSVFTAGTVGCLADSVRLLMDLKVPRIYFALSTLAPWDAQALDRLKEQLSRLRKLAVRHLQGTGEIPLDFFRTEQSRGIFSCAGGKNWLALNPEGRVWGCYLFSDYFEGREVSEDYERYCFGRLSSFRKKPAVLHARHAVHYARLTMDHFSTSRGPCFLCPDVLHCAVCPVNAALAGVPLGRIPDHLCAIQKIRARELEKFRQATL